MVKYSACIAVALAIVYGIILSYPGMFFKYSYEYKNMTVYSHETLKGDIDGVWDAVHEKMVLSEFFNPDFKFCFYIVKGLKEYSFLTAFKGKNYSYLCPLSGKIFLVSADFEKNEANCKNCDEKSVRDLDIIMASAAMKSILRQNSEFLKYIFISEWKKEGYGEYIAGESGYFEFSEICGNETDNLWLEFYKRHLAMKMLMIEDKHSFAAVLEKNVSYEGMLKRLKERHCR